MPSLTPTTGSASALLRTAGSLATQQADYQDAVKAFEYSNSAYTDEAFGAYADYLNGRINGLNSTGSLSAAQKALSLTRALDSAGKSNISASITRENIQIMAGNATLPDKYALVAGQFVRAINNGDLTLAQSLESQAYSINQSIQYQAQQAADAAATLARAGVASAKASGTTTAKGEEGVATSLTNQLKQFNKDFSAVGQKSQEKTLSEFVKSIQLQLDELGVVLPNGAKPNYFDVVRGVASAVYNAHALAGDAVAPYADDGGQSYYDKANAIVTGDTTFKTLSGGMSIQELGYSADALANGQLAYNATTGGFGKAPIDVPKGTTAAGFTFKVNDKGVGSVQTELSNNAFVTAPPKLAAQLSGLGLKFSPDNSGAPKQGEQVQVTKDSPDWLRKLVPNGTLLNVFQDQTGIHFKADASEGPGSSVYTIAADSTGKRALYEEGQLGSIEHGGDYGYNDGTPGVSAGGTGHFRNTSINSIKNDPMSLTLGLGKTNAQSVINQSAMIDAQTAAANQAAAAAMLAYSPPPLPNISIAPPIAPTPVAVAPNVAPNQSIGLLPNPAVAPRTTNPQPGATSPQNPGSIPLQGSGFKLQ